MDLPANECGQQGVLVARRFPEQADRLIQALMAWMEQESAGAQQFSENLQTIFQVPERSAPVQNRPSLHLRRQPSRVEAALAAARNFSQDKPQLSRSLNVSLAMR